ncbi:flagellar export chaperone FliS [Bacillus sp. PK3_68]|uniref:flagellar export chaperone FliS n=1 Tax=Bacillus sp. PK3_68 TaxID=2027408 RepID=UPI000E74673C|nr:flagellar export chaperone FliS [Bacillus sp. PK3_68]RJS60531.1 flagellar export chaperone FliS [Bacillus sp. PK3_68]
MDHVKAGALYNNIKFITLLPDELVVLLIEECIKAVEGGKTALLANDFIEKSNSLIKAQQIILELVVIINREHKRANHFINLYDYINRKLIEANLKNKEKILEEIKEYLIELEQAWKEAVKSRRIREYNNNLI